MRLFVAIDVNNDIKKEIGSLQNTIIEDLMLRPYDAKWVNPQQLHLTLKFLGQLSDKKSVEVCNIVESIANQAKGFDLEFKTLGTFGKRSAKILWVAAIDNSGKLNQLQKDLENKFVTQGFPGDNRAFTGHLTVCRVKSPKIGYKLKKASAQYEDFHAGSVLVDSLVVYSSQLTKTGPIYTPIGKYKLQ